MSVLNRAGPVVMLFRRDLRLSDNRALLAAIDSGRPVVPLFVLDEVGDSSGAAGKWWLHHSLAGLSRQLAALGAPLVLRRGATEAVLDDLLATHDISAVFTTRLHAPTDVALEQRLHAHLEAQGCALRRLRGALLFEPEAIRSQGGTPFKVFTPFWKACLALDGPALPAPAPAQLVHVAGVESEALEDWNLLPTRPDWSHGLREAWLPGEAAAQGRLEGFIDMALDTYAEDRDRPDRPGTSRLSPHLHFGEISPAQCWHRITSDPLLADRRGAHAFLRELGWRDFSAHLLFHWPQMTDAPFQPGFAAFAWREDREALTRWQQGRTGYPIVDAGMRELWQSGFMHNRVRMVCASFLTKHLLIHWREGAAWFHDTLVDADLASNTASWQWVAGCGADAAPYFRIFNPVLQGEKFDPDGAYVRHWVPEIAGLPDKWLHKPWAAPDAERMKAGIRRGVTYPEPMVEHADARQRALAAHETMKGGTL